MGGSDPYLIEVKTGARLNERGKRQAADIEKLHTFYETDVGIGLRGYPELRRMTPAAPERRYVDEMNVCIDEAGRIGRCVVNPEPGLHYAAIYDPKGSAEAAFGAMDLQAPWVFFLNAFKSDQIWSPYYPFTLSIKEPHHLFEFIQGRLFLMVVLETSILGRQLEAGGLQVTFSRGDEVPLKYKAPNGAEGGVSFHLLQRIGLEFVSPGWIVDYLFHALDYWSGARTGQQ